MYQEALTEQWDNLCSDFASEFNFLSKQGNATDSFNRWYEARIHRWSSVSYAEGIILSQLNNNDFAEQLIVAMKRFRFNEASSAESKGLWSGIPIGIMAGILCGGALSFFHWSTIRSIISGIVVAIVISGSLYKKNEVFNKKQQGNIKEAYIRQLADYRSDLLSVCKQFNVE
ncbi:MAG: hypothetical protein Q4D81_07400 [Eubacteriales bacterium]|nr:hypothetical protein [Eubacteriales bacterium]